MAEREELDATDVSLLAEIAEQYRAIPAERYTRLRGRLKSKLSQEIADRLTNRTSTTESEGRSTDTVESAASALRRWAEGNRTPVAEVLQEQT